jgi:hypothetical protein
MANSSQPLGAKPFGMPVRSPNLWVSGGVVYPGDFVSTDSTGRVVAASATSAILGVAANYSSAAGASLLVYDDPDQRFVIQADDSTVDAQTDIGLNYDILATAGDSTYKVSRMQMDASTQATTATLPLKLLAIEPSVGNALGSYVKCIVKINNHQLGQSTGTAGV